MRLPARFVAGNLIWARDGSVWAAFRVEPVSYPWLSEHEKLIVHRRTQAALMALPGEAMILSSCVPLSIAALRVRLTPAALPPRARPAWDTLTGLAERAAAQLGPTTRCCVLVAKLPAAKWGATPSSPSGSARTGVAEAFGLPAPRVGPAEVARRGRQSDHLLAQLRSHLSLRPTTSEEICWIYAAAMARGMTGRDAHAAPGPDPGPSHGRPGEPVRTARLVALADALLTEGGRPHDADRPLHRRYLRVETEQGVGYQALLAMSDMPHRYAFPEGGGEWLALADGVAFPVDWCVRIRPVANRVAQASARRQARHLQSQVGEYDGDPAGSPPGLAEAMEALEDLRGELAANPTGSELQVSTILAVGSSSLADLEERVRGLRAHFNIGEYDLHRPIGGQLGLFGAMLPGSAAGTPARDYVHHLLGRDLAAGMPFTGAGIGDPEGMLLGYSRDVGTFRPVLFDAGYGPRINRSASLGAFGALGSGKSYFIKSVVHATLASGGRVVALDRTPMGEYVRLSTVVPGTTQVVALSGDATICLDPLRVFSGEERTDHTLAFLSLVCGTSAAEPRGIALAEAVQEVASRPSGRLSDVVAALERAAPADPHADTVRRILRSTRRSPLAGLAFGEGPVPSLDADYLVFHAPGLALPDREVALREHLARQLLPEQVMSQAVLYLVAAVCRQLVFSDTRRFAAALFDEAWALTSSLQGRALLLDAVRDGRKHNAAVWLVSQHPGDLGDDELAHLLGPRFVFRQAAAAAAAALHVVGVEPSPRAIAFLASAPEGACLFRDVRDRVGAVQVLPAMSAALHEAFETNPLSPGRSA